MRKLEKGIIWSEYYYYSAHCPQASIQTPVMQGEITMMPKMIEAQQQVSNCAKVSSTSKDATILLKFAVPRRADQFNVSFISIWI